VNLNGGSLTGGEFVTESTVGGVVVFAIYQSLLASEVLAMGDQALVQLAGEHRDEAHSRVVPELWQVMQTLRLRVFCRGSHRGRATPRQGFPAGHSVLRVGGEGHP